jgi:hypothetical protein
MKCENKAKFISPDYKTILCEVDKEREKDRQRYITLRKTRHNLVCLLFELDSILMDFNICLAIARMFLKEERIKQEDLAELEGFKIKLIEDMEKFEQKFEDGTGDIQNLA